jgi:hypothetical protein
MTKKERKGSMQSWATGVLISIGAASETAKIHGGSGGGGGGGDVREKEIQSKERRGRCLFETETREAGLVADQNKDGVYIILNK